jgi:hypothetical protein
MDVQPRTVGAGQGWAWIGDGFRLFLRSPGAWIVLLLVLFVAKKAVYLIPVAAVAALLSLAVMLLLPVFLAGLMDGCRALDEGRRLQTGHLFSGFYRNAGQLVTIGGISLVGNLLVFMIVVLLGGDAMTVMVKTLSENPTTITPQVAERMQAATATVARAALFGVTLSLPLLMALWFAPLLVYFHDMKPVAALKLSFIACLKNTLPMLVYGLVLLAGLIVLAPIGIRFREFDLGLWLMAPVLIPSVYASYKDIFAVAGSPASPASGSPPVKPPMNADERG